jgi:stress-induced morphogen
MGMNLSANVADPEPQEVLQQITAAIHTIIKTRHLHPTRLEIELSEYDTVQIYMTAPEFSGKTYTEREMMIQPALEKVLPLNVIMNLSLLLLFAPEDEVEETQEERLLVA